MIRDDLIAAISRRPRRGRRRAARQGIHLERPARREHGDWSSNVAMATAKAAGRNPRELAGELADAPERGPAGPRRARSRWPGPGFVNFHLGATWLHDVLADVVDGGRPTATPATTSAPASG